MNREAEVLKESEISESLQRTLKDYQRRFRILDAQVRVLERERQKFSAVVNHTDTGFLVVDDSFKVIWANETASQRFNLGMDSGTPLGKACNQSLCGQINICQRCPVQTSLKTGLVTHQELQKEIEGECRQIYATAMPLRSPEGAIAEVMVMLQDLTDLEVLRRSQEAIKNSETQLRTVLDTVGEGIITIDAKSTIIMVNPEVEKIFGYSRAELIGQHLHRLMPEKYRAEHSTGNKRYLATGTAKVLGKRIELEGLRKNGQVFPLEIHIQETRIAERLLLTASLRDISERKRAEDELKNTLSLLSSTLESTADGILVVDQEGKMASFNKKFIHMWRIPDSIIASQDDNLALEFVLAQLKDPGGFLAKVKELYSQPEAESHDILEFKDGRVFERYSQPHRIGEKSVGRVWSFRDITERKKAEEALRRSEEQLRQSQKMEAVGRLAGGVAHDFNNLLTVILGRCEVLAQKIPTGDILRRDLELVQKTAERAASLTRQLLALSRKQVLQPRVINLNEALTGLDKMLKSMVGENVELVILPGSNLGYIKADSSQIEQVIMNLVVNAKEAMPQGGRLVMETKNLTLGQEYLGKQFKLPPDDYVVLKVTDTGAGMDPETLAHIFEPFFTTKEKGKGTGLGLATVYGIVKQSGGYIEAESQVGRGAAFTIYLPRVEEQQAALTPATAKLKIKPGRETILLVEDESAVRELIRDYLTQSGYAVWEAGGAAQALRIFQDNPHEVELIITDVIMPHMSGPALIGRIKNLNSEIQVLYISGYTNEAVLQQGILTSQVNFLQKPFSEKTFLKKVREILDRSQSTPQLKSY